VPSAAEKQRNNVRAGVFVTLTLVLAGAILVTLSGTWKNISRATNRYTVIYPLDAGVPNLRPGAEVRVGGVALGEVTDVEPFFAGTDNLANIRVHFNIDRRVKLYADAQIYVRSPLIGADAWLEIPSLGSSDEGMPRDALIYGAETGGLMDSFMGPEAADSVRTVIANVETFSGFLAEIEQTYDRDFAPALTSVRSTIEDVQGMVGEVRQDRWANWLASVDRTAAWLDGFTGQLDAALAEGHGMLTDTRAAISENRPAIDQIVTNVQVSTDETREFLLRLNDEITPKVEAFLARATEGVDSAAGVLARIEQDYEGWGVDLGETLASASLAGQQLKLATIEIRRSPWKLLYRPTADELEHELLYEAARSFALAVADLKSAARTTQSLLDRHSEALDADPIARQRLITGLIDSLSRYETAQTRLFEILVEEGP